MEYELVTSPCDGVIQEVFVRKDSQIEEGDKLFSIQDKKGNLLEIVIDIEGKIHSLEVQTGDVVVTGMVLAYVKEEIYAAEDHS